MPYGYVPPGTDTYSSEDPLCYWVWELDDYPVEERVRTLRESLGNTIKKLWVLVEKVKETVASGETPETLNVLSQLYEAYTQAQTRFSSLQSSSVTKRKRQEPPPSAIPTKVKLDRLLSSEPPRSIISFFSPLPPTLSSFSPEIRSRLHLFNSFPKPVLPPSFSTETVKELGGGVYRVEKRVLPVRSRTVLWIHDGKRKVFTAEDCRKVGRNPFARYLWVDYEEESEEEEVTGYVGRRD